MINLRIDKNGYKAKPNGYEIAKISNRLSDITAKEIPFNEFCSLIGEQGYSFCVSDLKDDILKLKKYSKVQILFKELKNGKDKYILTEFCDDYINYKTITKKNISTNVNAFMKATAIAFAISLYFSPVAGALYSITVGRIIALATPCGVS